MAPLPEMATATQAQTLYFQPLPQAAVEAAPLATPLLAAQAVVEAVDLVLRAQALELPLKALTAVLAEALV